MSYATDGTVDTYDMADALGVDHDELIDKLQELVIAKRYPGKSMDTLKTEEIEAVIQYMIEEGPEFKAIQAQAVNFFKARAAVQHAVKVIAAVGREALAASAQPPRTALSGLGAGASADVVAAAAAAADSPPTGR